MFIEYVCKNEKCSLLDKKQTKNVSLLDLEEETPQKCKECNQALERVWAFNGGIRTSDGYKG